MKSIIITGKQGLGKTELARAIAKSGKSYETDLRMFNQKNLEKDTEFIIIDEINSEKDFTKFKDLATTKSFTFRPRYAKENITINTDNILLIGISISPIDNQDARHSFIYNLY